MFKVVAITAACAWIAVSLILPPLVAHKFPSYALYQKTRDTLRPDMEIGSLEFNEPSLVWYFRSRVKGFMTPLRRRNVAEFMSRPGPRLVIIPTERTNAVLPHIPSHWTRAQTVGFNIPKGKNVDLTLFVKSE